MPLTRRFAAPLRSALLAALALAPPLLAQAAAPASPPVPSPAALEVIRTEGIRADLAFLASDEMRGRDTVSRGQRIAARYLVARLERLGFLPGAGEDYLHEYPLDRVTLQRDSLGAELTLGGATRALSHGVDYAVAGRWAAADLETAGGLVWCDPAAEDPFPAALAGNWAVCAHSGESLWRLFGPAQRAGAVGLLLVSAEGEDAVEVLPHYAGSNASAFEPRVSWPADGSSNRRRRPPFPVLALSDALRDELLAGAPAPGTVLDARLTERREADEGATAAENVCGLWPGSDPALRDEVILVSAHYDHVGANGEEIFNGADDNGSGTTGLLALADGLAAHGPLRRSVMLVWVSGEEKGLWGSRAWAQDPPLPEGMRAGANLNCDMIGRNGPRVLYVTPSAKHEAYNGLTALFERLAPAEGFGGFDAAREQGFEGLGSADEFYGRSDHAEFAKLGIPVSFLFAGLHEDYHRASDTVDKIDHDKIRRVARLVLRALLELQSGEIPGPAPGQG